MVEDEPLLREIYVESLKDEGIENVSEADNGIIAIEKLRNEKFDLIISDYLMPHANGGEVYLFNKTNSNIPFILISATDTSFFPEFYDYQKTNPLNLSLMKPLKTELLLSHLQKILEEIRK